MYWQGRLRRLPSRSLSLAVTVIICTLPPPKLTYLSCFLPSYPSEFDIEDLEDRGVEFILFVPTDTHTGASSCRSSTAWRRERTMSRERLRQSRQYLRQRKSQPRLRTVQDELNELRNILRRQVSRGQPPSLPHPTDYYGKLVALQPADAIHRLEVEADSLADGEIFTEAISWTQNTRPVADLWLGLYSLPPVVA